MAFKFLLSLLVLFSSVVGAQNSDDNAEKLSDFEYTQKIRKKIEKIAEVQPKSFRREIDKYRDDVQTYFEHKKRVCRGEFSTVILGSKEESASAQEATEDKSGKEKDKGSNEERKLSRDERKLCFREMKALQVTFINNMYKARRKYLEYLHEKRLKELDEARDQTIEDLKASFSSP